MALLVRDPFDAELYARIFLWEFVCCFAQRCLQASRNNKDSAVVRMQHLLPTRPVARQDVALLRSCLPPQSFGVSYGVLSSSLQWVPGRY
jgi:hypothetical protein